MTTDLRAVILAAGAGTRLGGVAKAMLRRADGERLTADGSNRPDTFLAAIVETARAVGTEDIVVVVGPPFGDEVAAHAQALGCRVVVNDDPSRGMASSIALGFGALLTVSRQPSAVSRAFLWPVDHPDVRAATLRALLAIDAAVVKPTFDGRGGHPPLIAAPVWPALAAATDDVRPILRGAVAVAVDDPGVVRDVDTPEDLACAR